MTARRATARVLWPVMCVLAAACSSSPSARTEPVASGRRSCGDLRFSVEGKATEGQSTLDIVITPRDAEGCDLRGVPTVELIGDPEHVLGGSYQLARQTGPARRVVLGEGRSARFRLTWLPDDQPGAWVPDYMRILLPQVRSPWILRWPAGGIVRQDAATHPGSFVGPIRLAG